MVDLSGCAYAALRLAAYTQRVVPEYALPYGLETSACDAFALAQKKKPGNVPSVLGVRLPGMAPS